MFRNFNAWHKVPKDADIPALTPYFTAEDGALRFYTDTGWLTGHPAGDRDQDLDYYTEEPILSPEEEKIEKRARTMYYMTGGIGWEYEDKHWRDNWLDLARKYVEK